MYSLNELTLEITKQCSMGCLICSSNGGVEDPNVLSFDQITKIIDDAKKLGVQTISISGGEPLESKICLNLIEYIDKLGLTIELYSCGNLKENNTIIPIDEKIFLKLKTLRVKKVIFSIHGPNNLIHDQLTNKKGSFDNLVVSIKRAKIAGLHTEMHFVPVSINYHFLPEVLNLANSLKISKISLLRFVAQGRGKINEKILSLSEEDMMIFKNLLENNTKYSERSIRIGAPYNCLNLDHSSCSAGLDKATIRPDGCVFPCVSMKNIELPNTPENVKSLTLIEIWNHSELFLETRKILNTPIETPCFTCNKNLSCFNGCDTVKILIKKVNGDSCNSYNNSPSVTTQLVKSNQTPVFIEPGVI